MGRGWHGTAGAQGSELCPCRPVGTMGEWWGAGSYRGHQASPSLLDAGVRLCLFPLQPWRVTPAPGPGAVGSSRRPRPWICGPGLLTFAGAGPAGSTKVTPLKPLKGQTVQPGRGLGPQSWLACGLLAPGCPWLSFPIGRFGDPCAQSHSLQRVGALGLFPSSRRLFGGPGVAGLCPSPSHCLPTALLWRLQFFPISFFSCFRLLLSPSCSHSEIETSAGPWCPAGFLPEAAGAGTVMRADSPRGQGELRGSGAELGAGRAFLVSAWAALPCAGPGTEAQEVRACPSACGAESASGSLRTDTFRPLGWRVPGRLSWVPSAVREGLLEVVGHSNAPEGWGSGRDEREVGSGLGWSLARCWAPVCQGEVGTLA